MSQENKQSCETCLWYDGEIRSKRQFCRNIEEYVFKDNLCSMHINKEIENDDRK